MDYTRHRRRQDRGASAVEYIIATADGRQGTLEVTPNHLVQVLDGDWVPAGELTPGRDQLLAVDGTPLELRVAESQARNEPVFNLEVEDFHTYFVGDLGVWVHNGGPNAPPIQELPLEPDPPAVVAGAPEPVVIVRRRRRRGRVNVDAPPLAVPPPPPVAAPPPPVDPRPP